MKTKLPVLVMSLACLSLLGCRSARFYHGTQSVFSSAEANTSSAFVELDDHGELWDARQVSRAAELISNSRPAFVVTYIHGWKNNADLANPNYQGFTNMLSELARELRKNPETRFTVVGVYIGWHGDTVLFKDPFSHAARQLTFWSRRNAAERVAGTSATETLYTILQAAKSHRDSKVVLIGHSMGALILEKALSQAMVSSLRNPATERCAPADLVLLINSAAPSLYARQFISMLNRLPTTGSSPCGDVAGQETFDADHPLVVSATSKGDWATGKVFPLGMWLGSLNKSFRHYGTNEEFGGKQSHYYRTTAGHNRALVSHAIDQVGTIQRRPRAQRTAPSKQQAAREALRNNLTHAGPRNQFTVSNKNYCVTYRIAPIEERENKTPYWVMRLPKKVVKDHGDIFNEGFTAFVGAFLRIAEVEGPRRHIDPRQFKAAR